jgi:glycosyltransferase involved in cell wall biosynthesis
LTDANPVANPVASIIIPTLNEESTISETISRIPATLRACCQILVIDGLSTDATIDEAKRVGADILLVDQPGKGFAMREGAHHAKSDVLLFIDGDGTYPSEAIPKFLQSVRKGIMVLGNAIPYLRSRDTMLQKLRHLYPSFMLTRFLFSRSGIHLQDPLNGMRAITKHDFQHLHLTATGFEIETEMNIKAIDHGMKIVELPIRITPRTGNGKSKFLFNFRSHLKILKLLRRYKKKNGGKRWMPPTVKEAFLDP